ncbi:MAG: hypothetical protein OHK0013_39150 [Sandaracinaceae bacterium]
MSPLVLSVVGASLLIGLAVLALVIVLAIRARPAELSAAEPPREDRPRPPGFESGQRSDAPSIPGSSDATSRSPPSMPRSPS